MTTQELKDKFQKARYNRTVRSVVLVVLLLILLAMYFFWGKMKGLLLGLIIVITLALGVHIADYDLDLETLFRTGSLTESRVETKKGVKIIGSDCIGDNLNCADFKTQPDAQSKYEYCSDKIASDNSQIKDRAELNRLDVYGLDGDKDGVVCEALPKALAN